LLSGLVGLRALSCCLFIDLGFTGRLLVRGRLVGVQPLFGRFAAARIFSFLKSYVVFEVANLGRAQNQINNGALL